MWRLHGAIVALTICEAIAPAIASTFARICRPPPTMVGMFTRGDGSADCHSDWYAVRRELAPFIIISKIWIQWGTMTPCRLCLICGATAIILNEFRSAYYITENCGHDNGRHLSPSHALLKLQIGRLIVKNRLWPTLLGYKVQDPIVNKTYVWAWAIQITLLYLLEVIMGFSTRSEPAISLMPNTYSVCLPSKNDNLSGHSSKVIDIKNVITSRVMYDSFALE